MSACGVRAKTDFVRVEEGSESSQKRRRCQEGEESTLEKVKNFVRQGQIKLFKTTCREDKTLFSERDEEGNTLTLWCCHQGFSDVASWCLSKHPTSAGDRQVSTGLTPMLIACSLGELNLVKKVHCKDPLTLYSMDNANRTPLLQALEQGHIEVASWILDQESYNITSKEEVSLILFNRTFLGDERVQKVLQRTTVDDLIPFLENIETQFNATAFSDHLKMIFHHFPKGFIYSRDREDKEKQPQDIESQIKHYYKEKIREKTQEYFSKVSIEAANLIERWFKEAGILTQEEATVELEPEQKKDALKEVKEFLKNTAMYMNKYASSDEIQATFISYFQARVNARGFLYENLKTFLQMKLQGKEAEQFVALLEGWLEQQDVKVSDVFERVSEGYVLDPSAPYYILLKFPTRIRL
jgi:hypothetical protein